MTLLGHLRVVQDVEGLQAVGEGDPDEITKRQHEAEAFCRDVHGGQDGGLEPQCICDIPAGLHQSHCNAASCKSQVTPTACGRLRFHSARHQHL